MDGHLATFEAWAGAATGAGVLALVALAAGFAKAGAFTLSFV